MLRCLSALIIFARQREAAGKKQPCTVLSTAPRNDTSQPQSSDWLIDSRGGTRTRDPGIMRRGLGSRRKG
jgi:hypothetical protein